MASSFKSPILQAIDQNGDPVPGAKLYVYASGTITPVAVFSNAALSVALPNPIIANARGYFASAGGIVQNIFWNGDALRLLLTDASDATIWQIDDYSAVTGGVVLSANNNFTGVNTGGNATSLAELKARSVVGLTGGETVTLNDGGRSGVFAWVAGNQSSRIRGSAVSITSIDTGTNILTRVAHGFLNGFTVIANTSDAGLTQGTYYYVRRINADTFTLHTTLKGAYLNTDVAALSGVVGSLTLSHVYDPAEGVYIAPNSDPTGASGMWARVGRIAHVDAGWFGAVGNATADDFNAFQQAILWLESDRNPIKKRGGWLQWQQGQYRLTAPLVVSDFGIGFQGLLPERTLAAAVSGNEGGILFIDHTNGPGVWVRGQDFTARDVSIRGSTARRAGAIGTGTATNCGMLIAPNNASVAVGYLLENVMTKGHPADGIVMAQELSGVVLIRPSVIDVGRHGISVDDGRLLGLANNPRPGIVDIINPRVRDCGGHGFAIGHPSSAGNFPYRVTVKNAETFNNGTNAAVLYAADHAEYFSAEQLRVENSGFARTYVHGRTVRFLDNRYFGNSDTQNSAVTVADVSGLNARRIVFDGGEVFDTGGAGVLTNFIATTAGRELTIRNVGGQFTNLISQADQAGSYETALPGVWTLAADDTNVNGTLVLRQSGTGDPTIRMIADGVDWSIGVDQDATETFRIQPNASLNSAAPFQITAAGAVTAQNLDVTLTTGERSDYTANDTSTSGQIRIVNNGTGDATFVVAAGGTTWSFGTDNSNGDAFGIQNAASLTTAAPFLISTAGVVIVNVMDNDLEYRVAGTKVVGARVINAALGNTANSGDANTDALIEALKAIITTHGLGAAS